VSAWRELPAVQPLPDGLPAAFPMGLEAHVLEHEIR